MSTLGVYSLFYIMNSQGNNEIIRTIKEWASPALIAIIGTLMWRDMNELRTDVKALLIAHSADKVRIEMLEKQIMSKNIALDNSLSINTVKLCKVDLPVWMKLGPFKKEEAPEVGAITKI